MGWREPSKPPPKCGAGGLPTVRPQTADRHNLMWCRDASRRGHHYRADTCPRSGCCGFLPTTNQSEVSLPPMRWRYISDRRSTSRSQPRPLSGRGSAPISHSAGWEEGRSPLCTADFDAREWIPTLVGRLIPLGRRWMAAGQQGAGQQSSSGIVHDRGQSGKSRQKSKATTSHTTPTKEF